MKLSPFYAANAHLNEFWGITLTDDEFENIGMHGWDKINNKISRLYRFQGVVKNFELELPCNVDIIESVHSHSQDYSRKDNISTNNYTNLSLENDIESFKSGDTNPFYTSGKLINYEEGNGVLYFKTDGIAVTVVYKGIVLDDDGLPSLNYKEVEAIANYCAFVSTRKKGMITKDQATIQLAQMLQQEWQRTCDDARNPIHLSQNDMNELLDVKSSWNRKRYNSSFKPLN